MASSYDSRSPLALRSTPLRDNLEDDDFLDKDGLLETVLDGLPFDIPEEDVKGEDLDLLLPPPPPSPAKQHHTRKRKAGVIVQLGPTCPAEEIAAHWLTFPPMWGVQKE